MPTRLDYTTDEQADERLNPASEINARETAAAHQIGEQIDDTPPAQNTLNDSTVDDSSKDISDKENSAANNTYNYQQPAGRHQQDKSKVKGFANFMKRRGPVVALGGGLGVASMLFIGAFSGFTMLINITENLTDTNDSASTAKAVRLKPSLRSILSKRDGYKSDLKFGKPVSQLSNKGLSQLKKNGVLPTNADGSNFEFDAKAKGYPSKQPSHFTIEGVNGGKPIPRDSLVGTLLEKGNEKHANKVFGRTGAFKMRVRAWTGKHIQTSFLKKFKLSRNGGIAKSVDKKLKVHERINKFKEKLPKFNTENAKKGLSKKIGNHMGKAKKAGVVYTTVVAGCIGVKIPSMLAVGVAAVQLAPVISVVNDVILSPGSMAKASGFDSGFTPEAMDTIGTTLTERGTTEGSNNPEGSALDSPILLAAMGVNNKKTNVSQYAPGYSFFNNPIIQAAKKVEDFTEPACNAVLSPVAMYGAMAAEIAFTVYTGGIGGVVSWIGKEIVSKVVTNLVEDIASGIAGPVFTELAKNDMVPKARYRDFGDLLGVGAAAFFSSGNMAQMLPVLNTDQLAEFNKIKLAEENFQKQMDIASLSPFDTSSKYTFLGSIVRNMGNIMLANHSFKSSASSIFTNVLKLPAFAFSLLPKAQAKNGVFTEAYCGYADAFGQKGEQSTPAVNMAGLPCTGITNTQANMSTEEALSIAKKEGWFDESVDVPEGATISELVESKYIKPDTPLSDFIESCSDASTGEYWTNMSGCITPSGATGSGKHDSDSVIDDKSLAAIPVLLIDYQIGQSINGEDEETDVTGAGESTGGDQQLAAGTPDNVDQHGEGWTLKPGVDYSNIPCEAGTTEVGIYDAQVGTGKSKIKICSVTVGSTTAKIASIASKNLKAMLEAAAADGVVMTSQSDFRSSAEQQVLYNKYCNGSGPCKASKPGSSQHERGLAVDWGIGGKSFCYPNATCPGNKGYDWMVANAAKYGFYKISIEAWHWSTSGR